MSLNFRSPRPSDTARLCSQCHGYALACEACDASGWDHASYAASREATDAELLAALARGIASGEFVIFDLSVSA